MPGFVESVCICVCVCVCMYVSVCVYIYIYTHTHYCNILHCRYGSYLVLFTVLFGNKYFGGSKQPQTGEQVHHILREICFYGLGMCMTWLVYGLWHVYGLACVWLGM
jgi:hypothetical protein